MKKKILSFLVVIFTFSMCLFTLTACFGDLFKNKKLTSNTGIVIEGYQFEEGAEISFNYVNDESVIQNVKTALSTQNYQKTADIHVLDISVIKDGQKFQPNVKVTVSIPISLIGSIDMYAEHVVYHIKEDATIESLSAVITGGNVCFDTTSFSTFVLAERNLAPIGPVINNDTDLEATDDDNLFTSVGLDLVTEINGSFTANKPFSLDSGNSNKRVYDNLYLYQYDYFYMISSDYTDIWCRLSDKTDLQYVEIEREDGEDIQVNVKVSGIYKLIFDTVTKSFDIEYKSEITTPIYEEILKCEIGYLDASKNLQFIKMQKKDDELVVENFQIDSGKSVGFYSEFTHTSWYKTTLEEVSASKYVYKQGTKPSTDVYFMFSGTYNVYLNPKTYVVRIEVVSIDAYSAVVYENNEFKNLQLADQNVKHIFVYYMTVTSMEAYDFNIVMEELPKIYNASNRQYNLQLTEESLSLVRFSYDKTYFDEEGTYRITINLQTFEMDLELLPE